MEAVLTRDSRTILSSRTPVEKQQAVPELDQHPKVNVVLFTGGRGSTVLSKQLISNSKVALTLAINGYDDGASTGEVRRFLGDCLGPSDYRKNASRLARELQSCRPALVDLLDLRFPVGYPADQAIHALRIINGQSSQANSEFHEGINALMADIDASSRKLLTRRLELFENQLLRNDCPFSFSDCSLGNLVFAGCFLQTGRDFNAAIADYCSLLNLATDIIENVTNGANAYLVAVDLNNRIIANEAEIVSRNAHNNIKDIYLIDQPLTVSEINGLMSASQGEVIRFLEERIKTVRPNPCLVARLAQADLIIYSPGTQYSSLFPSYMTPELGTTIAKNLTAIKLLITNIKEDAEIPGKSAVDIIDRAVYYLNEKNRHRIPTPCLITHYLINDPSRVDRDEPYIPLGQVESLEDPRLVRIGNYEDGVSGRHNAAKILTPFIESFLNKGFNRKLAVLLLDGASLNKISQTILEMLRGGIQNLPVTVTVFYDNEESFDQEFAQTIPFEVHNLSSYGLSDAISLYAFLKEQRIEYVILFESSGMYKGEDIVNLATYLSHGRLDAVWGSRRLSVKDIRQSYRLRYRKNFIFGAISYAGSHVLSLVYLLLYGRYISDTLSAVRALRTSFLRVKGIELKNKSVNQRILSVLLRHRADVFETPVQFFPLSPEKVKRTNVLDGLKALGTIFWWRIRRLDSRGNLNESKPELNVRMVPEHAFSE